MADKPTIKRRVKLEILPSSDAQEEVELDYRIAVTGDFSRRGEGELHKDGKTLKDRRVRVIRDRRGLKKTLSDLNPKLNLSVPNRLKKDATVDDVLKMDLDFKEMKDFHPDQIVQNVPHLKELWEKRRRLIQLKMEVLSNPDVKSAMQEALTADDQSSVVDSLLKNLAPADDKKSADKNNSDDETK